MNIQYLLPRNSMSSSLDCSFVVKPSMYAFDLTAESLHANSGIRYFKLSNSESECLHRALRFLRRPILDLSHDILWANVTLYPNGLPICFELFSQKSIELKATSLDSEFSMSCFKELPGKHLELNILRTIYAGKVPRYTLEEIPAMNDSVARATRVNSQYAAY